MRIDPQNQGVLLRRTLDYGYPNQPEVFVADASRTDLLGVQDFQPAGIWYVAGSNRAVFSDPKDELGATEHIVWESNRRFRDDEFLISRSLTAGRSGVRLRVRFTPVERPLFPDDAMPTLAWSEIRYVAYSYVTPAFSSQTEKQIPLITVASCIDRPG